VNLLDLGILVLLGLITVRGYYRGLFQELAFLVGLVGGIIVAAHSYLRLAVLLRRWIADTSTAQIVAFAIVLVAVYWLTRLVAHFLQRLLYHLYLDFFDRLLGGAFALAKGALLVGFALIFLGVFIPKDSHLVKGSRTSPHLMRFSKQSLELLPPDFKTRVTQYVQQWLKGTNRPKGGGEQRAT
jgi:membrane protein required for colicin V production